MADRVASLKQKYGIADNVADTPTATTSAPKSKTASLIDKYGLQDIASASPTPVSEPQTLHPEERQGFSFGPTPDSAGSPTPQVATAPSEKPSFMERIGDYFGSRQGGPPAKIPVEQKSTLDRNLTAGFGDVAASLGSVANMMGKQELAKRLKLQGEKLQSEATKGPDYEGVKSLFDPQYLSTRGVRSLAFPAAMAPLTVAGAGVGTLAAGAAGLGTLGTTIAASLGGAIASRPAESAMEAAQTYEEAVSRGMSEEEAQRAARGVFWKNNALVVTDAGELFTALAPLPKPIKSMLGLTTKGVVNRLLFGAAKVLGTAVQEAGEEGVQEIFQRQGLGDHITFDKSMQEQMGLGALMGGGMALAGAGVDIKGTEKTATPAETDTPMEAPAPVAEASVDTNTYREPTTQERTDVTAKADSALQANNGDVEATLADMSKHAQAAREDNNTEWLATWEPVIEELNRRNTTALKGEYTWSLTGDPVTVVKDDGGPQVEVQAKSGQMWVRRDDLSRGQTPGDVVTFGGQEYIVQGKDESGRLALLRKGQTEARVWVKPEGVTPTGRKEALPAKVEAPKVEPVTPKVEPTPEPQPTAEVPLMPEQPKPTPAPPQEVAPVATPTPTPQVLSEAPAGYERVTSGGKKTHTIADAEALVQTLQAQGREAVTVTNPKNAKARFVYAKPAVTEPAVAPAEPAKATKVQEEKRQYLKSGSETHGIHGDTIVVPSNYNDVEMRPDVKGLLERVTDNHWRDVLVDVDAYDALGVPTDLYRDFLSTGSRAGVNGFAKMKKGETWRDRVLHYAGLSVKGEPTKMEPVKVETPQATPIKTPAKPEPIVTQPTVVSPTPTPTTATTPTEGDTPATLAAGRVKRMGIKEAITMTKEEIASARKDAKTAKGEDKADLESQIAEEEAILAELTKKPDETPTRREEPAKGEPAKESEAKEPWRMTWAEIKAHIMQERDQTPTIVARAEAKYAKVRAKFEEDRAKKGRQIKAANMKIDRLNPTGDTANVSTSDKRLIEETEVKRDTLSEELKAMDIPIRSHFVEAEFNAAFPNRRNVPSGQYEHKKAVEKAISEGKTIPPEVLADYPDLKPKESTKAPDTPAYAGARPTLPQTAPPLAPVSRRQIVKYLDNAFAPLRVGFLSKVRGALGIAKLREGVVRTKLAEDFPVQMHEIGHLLDKQMTLADPSFDAELLPLGTPTAPQGSTQQYIRGEGVGEFIRLYVTDPAEAVKRAPTFANLFDARLNSEPDVKAKLDGARLLMQRWTSQDPHAKLDGVISVDEKGSARPVTLESLRAQLIEQLAAVERATKVMAGGQKLKVSENPFELALLARGWAGRAETFLEHGTVDVNFKKNGESFKDILNDAPDVQEFRRYLVSKRAKELIAKRELPIEEVLGVGVSVADVDKVLQDLAPQYDALSRRLVKFQDAVLQELVDAGRISHKEATEMRKWNADYIPFYRFFDEKTGEFNFAGANHLVNVGNPIKAFKGSGRSIVDPLESVVKNTFTIINAAQRNNVGRTLLDLAEKSNNLGRLVEIADEGAHENTVNVYRNGEKVRLKVDPELHRSLLFLDHEQTAMWVKMVGMPASTLRAGAILNPDFMVSNPFVDQFTAFINSEFGYVPFLDLARGGWHSATKDDLFWQWKAAGGAQSTMVSIDRDHLQKELDKLLHSGKLNKGNVLRRMSPLEILRTFSEQGELGTRLGEFAKGTQTDSSREGILQAALASRDVTLDFAATGSKTKTVNRISAFFNASIQGLDKTAREFKAHPVRTFVRATAAYTVPTIALYLLNRNNPNYDEKDEWVKDVFWLIPTDWSNPSQSKGFLYLPKKHALAMTFGALPERMLRAVDKRDRHAFDTKFAQRFASSLVPNLPMPTAIMPLLENVANYSFYTDLPIVPRREQNLEAVDQYGPYTSEASKGAARLADKVGLGFSPRKADHLIKGFTGGLGTLGADIASKGIDVVGLGDNVPKPERGAAGFPIGRRFLRDAGGAGPGSSVDNFYNAVNKLEKRYASTPKGTADKERQLEFLRPLRKMADEMSDLNAEKRAIAASKSLTPQEKRTRIDAIDLKMTNIARDAYGKPPIR